MNRVLFLMLSLTLSIVVNNILTTLDGYAITFDGNATPFVESHRPPSAVMSLHAPVHTESCIEYPNKFQITYPTSNLSKPPLSSFNQCSFFKLNTDITLPGQTYVRICPAIGLTNSSIREISDNVKFFASSFLHLDYGPYFYGIDDGSSVAEMYFRKNSSVLDQTSSQSGLPFVDQLCTLPTVPLVQAQASALINRSNNGSALAPSPISGDASSNVSSPSSTKPSEASKIPDNTMIEQQTAAFYIVSHDGQKVYAVEYTAPTSIFNNYIPIIRDMVASFKFTDLRLPTK
jgi:hypothetical protein